MQKRQLVIKRTLSKYFLSFEFATQKHTETYPKGWPQVMQTKKATQRVAKGFFLAFVEMLLCPQLHGKQGATRPRPGAARFSRFQI